MVITEKTDVARIKQLEQLTDKDTFWDDVIPLCRKVKGKYAIAKWQALCEQRYQELCGL